MIIEEVKVEKPQRCIFLDDDDDDQTPDFEKLLVKGGGHPKQGVGDGSK